jgi:SAM-dependent methyltransferase
MARLVCSDGSSVQLQIARWMSEPSTAERQVLGRSLGPVLDVGCGPGRHVLALARAGRIALGVDASPSAIDIARAQGAPVLLRSIFGRVPAAGRWGSALLLDGSIGIGGDPAALLRRVAGLLRHGGKVLAEVEPPGVRSCHLSAWLETDRGSTREFPWARVGADGVRELAAQVGFLATELWGAEGRWFANLQLL